MFLLIFLPAFTELLKSSINMDSKSQSVCHVQNGIFIRQRDFYRKYLYTDILWIEADGSYCDIHFIQGNKIIVIHSLTQMEHKLPSNIFVRIHRSYIVNMHHVDAFVGNILYIGKKRIPISNPYRQQVSLCFDILEESKSPFRYKKQTCTKDIPQAGE
ncbi:LytR/AlgR family response regulator transcription factor [Parabacteroides bouchesdurhonensis]|uniref:LytR/AlgR family response regulator transcription factor n=1 Tax=Parabacteroides bouchesdurhonensis TaxID=1936995 RepID=UPI000E534B39|nr:LytTR family DNA-binding domain-containing protein [Parabacteroides bouchesdurhonensis]RHJ91314.1 LytTR family transcriptional regulator [Bacteroides sp. AM07-16]